MKLNKLIVATFACANLIGFTACNSFLDEDPKSSLTSSAYYKTESQAWGNVNYLYRTGAPTRLTNAGSAYIGPFASVLGQLTGYFTNSYEGQEIVCQYSRLLTRQDNTMTVSVAIDGVWDACYKAINVANGAITHIPSIQMSESDIAKLVAEAKFFRAFNYFYLVKTFGAIPMYTTPYESMENLYLERTPVEKVYELIESDLKEAVNVLPALMFANNGHRITKYVAAMMLTNVYMQQGKYADAATYAKIVIDSPHKLTKNENMGLESAYNILRSKDDLDESVYAYEFDNTISKGGWWPTYAFSSSAVSVFPTYSIFERVYGPEDQFLNVYEKNDLRIQPYQFFAWEYTNPTNNKTWKSDVAGCWYFFQEQALLETGIASKDINIFRYAEALLAGAESIVQSTGAVSSEAAGYLAQVKARANMDGKTESEIAAELVTLSPDAFIQACWTERLREFPLEFKIWDDCLRTKMFPVISKTTPGEVQYVPLIGAQNAAGATFKESDLLWPISLNEMQRNPNLTQNPGYQNN